MTWVRWRRAIPEPTSKAWAGLQFWESAGVSPAVEKQCVGVAGSFQVCWEKHQTVSLERDTPGRCSHLLVFDLAGRCCTHLQEHGHSPIWASHNQRRVPQRGLLHIGAPVPCGFLLQIPHSPIITTINHDTQPPAAGVGCGGGGV